MGTRRHAKASSAGSISGTGSRRARFGYALACLVALLAFGGSGVPAALAAEPPAATTEAAGSVGASTATLNGKVNPRGVAIAQCRFEYGTTTAYGATTSCLPASLGTGNFNVSVSAQMEALEPGVTYHYRLVAASVNGASQGEDHTFATTGTPVCPNADRRLEQGIASIQLPDCMALEQVSPPQKGSQRAQAPTISANGERVAFKTLAGVAGTPGNFDTFNGDIYVATRGESAWTSAPTSPPPPYHSGWSFAKELARNFDPTLSHWVTLASEQSQYDFGISQLFRGSLGGFFEPASPLLVPSDLSLMLAPSGADSRGQINVRDSVLQGSSRDHARLYLSVGDPAATYLPGDPVISGAIADNNVYLAQHDPGGQLSLKLMARDEVGPDAGTAWGGSCGARVGGIDLVYNQPVGGQWRNQGAVSADGSRAYISARVGQPASGACSAANKLRILKRTEASGLADVTELMSSECTRVAPACSSTDGDDLYQGASVDGSKVYFLTNRQLANSDLDGSGSPSGCAGVSIGGCDLYLYDTDESTGEKLTQISAGEANLAHPVAGEGADVSGVVAISGDGSHIYFAAAGVLTEDPNPVGKTAAEYPASNPKLYAWSTSSPDLRFVGPLSTGDSELWAEAGTFLRGGYPVPATGENGSGEEVGGDGHVLLFQSSASLTANDTDGGQLDSFRYDAGNSTPSALQCVSCQLSGSDSQPFGVQFRRVELSDAPGTAFAEDGRWVSEDGNAVLVRTKAALLPSDTNGEVDDYLWKEGRFTRLPGTSYPKESRVFGDRVPVLSHDGKEVAFTAYTALLPSDIDTASDVYVARVDGGFPNPVTPESCLGEGCRPAKSAAPGEQNTTSAAHRGRGNVKGAKTRACPKGKRRVSSSKQKARCAKRGHKRRANNGRGGQK